MSQENKKWVFTELVKDPNNIEQLISYAIYKGFKDEKAQSLRKENKSEAEIEDELVKYHDHCLTSPKQLDVFRGKASQIVGGYVAAANSVLQTRANAEFAKFEAERKKDIAALEKKAKDAEKAALKKLMSGAEQYSKLIKKPVGFFETSKAWGWALIKFLFSGVPKLFATAFSIGLLFSLYGFINGDAITGLRKGLYKTIDLTVPGERVVSEKRDVSSITPEGQEAPAEKSPATAGHNH
ncbi:hypothetical protein [Pantoea agglomerans]|uniref:hypothetical protein n=1 Tax=Enterobacter agglomerans TaxID=549 RepID=UPI0005346BCC|nr:hypothetical protein [Pantoea agglomerans]